MKGYFCNDSLSIYVKNWLDPVIRPDYLTHSVTTIIKNTLRFVGPNVRKILHMPTKENPGLKQDLTDRQTDRQRRINIVKMFSYKKGLIYTEHQLPYL